MERSFKIGCVVMAAGNARRFGENKLTVKLQNRSLILRTLEAIPPEVFHRVVVVTQYPEISQLAQTFRFSAVHNDRPDDGISHTIQLGLAALSDCDGVMFLVSDQPLLQQETISQLAALWQKHPNCIAAAGHNGVHGNPCLFPARFFPELMALTGDRGGSQVIRLHPESLLLLETAKEELADVDTPEALRSICTRNTSVQTADE